MNNPPANNPGIGTSYTIPDATAPNGPNLFPPNSEAVTSGKAKPEIFAMGVRNLYSIDVDKVTGKIAAAWVGPDQGTNSTTWGPAKTENAVVITSAGNYGWPFCTGNQQGYRAKLPANTGGGRAAPAGHPGTVVGNDTAAGSGGGGFWDCDDPNGILNTSPYNTGLERIPAGAARPTSTTARRAGATTSPATTTASRRTTPRTRPRTRTPPARAIAAARSCSAVGRRR